MKDTNVYLFVFCTFLIFANVISISISVGAVPTFHNTSSPSATSTTTTNPTTTTASTSTSTTTSTTTTTSSTTTESDLEPSMFFPGVVKICGERCQICDKEAWIKLDMTNADTDNLYFLAGLADDIVNFWNTMDGSAMLNFFADRTTAYGLIHHWQENPKSYEQLIWKWLYDSGDFDGVMVRQAILFERDFRFNGSDAQKKGLMLGLIRCIRNTLFNLFPNKDDLKGLIHNTIDSLRFAKPALWISKNQKQCYEALGYMYLFLLMAMLPLDFQFKDSYVDSVLRTCNDEILEKEKTIGTQKSKGGIISFFKKKIS